jgi:hypothetical protein
VSGTEATATQVTLSALTAVANVSQVSLQWAITDPSSTGLGYLGLAAVEVWAASTNDRAGAAKVTEGLTSAVHDAIPEGDTRYYWVKPRNRNGTFGSFFPSGTTSGVAATARDQAGMAFGLANGKLVASVSSNALTVAIKTAAGNDPSASDPVFIAFRNSTLTTGNSVIRAITAALSVVISNGSLLGVGLNNTPFRIWVAIFDDGGTLRLAVFNASNSFGTIYPLAEAAIALFTDVDNGSGNADSGGVFYTNSALTTKLFRVVGWLDFGSGLSTAGQWNAGPTAVRLAGLGAFLPGSLVSNVSGFDVGVSGNTLSAGVAPLTIPFDDTIPQSGEGLSWGTSSITLAAASPCNFFEVEAVLNLSHSVVSEIVMALFMDSAASATAAVWDYIDTANGLRRLHFIYRLQAATLSARSFELRYGASQAGTIGLNRVAGNRKLGGVAASFISIKEISG